MNLQVGVKLLIKNKEGQYLFLRRAQSFKPGMQKWDIPGGRINPEEPLETALTREVTEETGLVARTWKLLAAQDIFVDDKDQHVVRLTYIGTVQEGTIAISDEHSEYKWMTKDEALQEPLDSYLEELNDLF